MEDAMSMINPDLFRVDLIHNMICCPFSQLYEMLAHAMAGPSGYRKEDIEAAIREKIDLPLFQDGTIVRLDLPSDTPKAVRERVVQIHADVCARWGCDPSWSRDPKA
jgi:hypothetical protein